MTFEPEFIKALQLLPDKEKDKLILRLLKHDMQLTNRLLFELVATDSVEDRRAQLSDQVIKKVQRATGHYYSTGYLLMEVREISGEINQHVSITKDKFGEISLNCLMLRQLLEQNNKRIASESYGKAYTLCVYIVARLFKLLMLIQKQHEDLHMEFREDIEAIGELMGRNPNLMKTAIYNGLDVNWLIHFEIPENIVEIHRELRNNGLLK
jgi:DNA replication protein DnaD